MPTLYRTYRPQTFADVSGQDHIKLTLEYEIKSGQVAHAYLFCGPRAIGKTTVARLLAKSLDCEKRSKKSAEPCNECQNCADIMAGRSLDVMEIDAASHTGVDNVRETVIASARVAPSRSAYKVFIIDEAHMLSTAAWNALLKIMEEPPAHVVFILCTTEAHKVPVTIISRCQRFDFRKIGYADILKKLTRIAAAEKVDVEPAVLEAVARHAGGHMRDAESLFGQVIALGAKPNSIKGKKITLAEAELVIPRGYVTEAITLLEHLSERDAASGVAFLNRLADDGADMAIVASEVIDIGRRILLSRVNQALGAELLSEFGESSETKLLAIARRFEPAALSTLINRFSAASREVKDAPIAQLPLELAVVDSCYAALSPAAPAAASPPSPQPRPAAGEAKGKQVETALPAEQPGEKPDASAQAPLLSEEAIGSIWRELLVRIRPHNHSLSFVLKSCQPTSLKGSVLTLTFKYKLHYDRMGDTVMRALVEGVLAEIAGTTLMIRTALDPTLILVENVKPEGTGEASDTEAAPDTSQTDASVIDNLLKTFGGRVVG